MTTTLALTTRRRPLAPATLSRLTARLHALRIELDRNHERLISELVDSTLGADLSDMFDNHVAPTCGADRDSLWQMARAHRRLCDEIDAALDRVREGTYGRCDGCGVDIPVVRLEAVPHSPFCVGCA